MPSDYEKFLSVRAKALIALRKKDTNWVRYYRDGVDVLGPLDKRAVLYSSKILPLDEMSTWVNAIAASGDVLDKSIARYLIATTNSN